MTAWRRETMASGSTMSLEGSRPMERRVRASGTSRFEDEVGLTISFAIRPPGNPPRSASRSHVGLLERHPDLDLGPLLLPRRILPFGDRREHRLVHPGVARVVDLDVGDVALLGDHEGAGH